MRGISGIFGILILVLIAAFFLFTALNPAELPAGEELKKFSSYEELKSFLEENTESQYYGMALGTYQAGISRDLTAVEAPTAAPDAGEAGAAKGGSQDFSTTNIQVSGVDEADIVKTDGKYIYAISMGRVYVIDAYPAEGAEVLSEINTSGYPSEMYINGDNLVVLTSGYGGYYPLKGGGVMIEEVRAPGSYSGPVSSILVYDVSDASEPVLKDNITIEGNYYDSRMIGDYVYVISQKPVYSIGDPGIPRILAGGKAIGSGEVYYFDVPGYSYQFTSVVSFNVRNQEEPNSKVFLMSYGQNIYVSRDNVYVTYRKQISQKKIFEDVMEKVIIPNLPPDLSLRVSRVWNSDRPYNDKMTEISEILQEYIESLGPEESAKFMQNMQEKMEDYYIEISKELEKSLVHRISISDGEIEYQAGGSVPGNILNQFSMDEYGSHFRVATTTSGWMGGMRGETLNHLYVLDMDMNIVGRLENLAEGESIYSVRFMGEKAYMVTFRRIDPLFVIDLSDPADPKVLGKLKIPGYSDYLHPYDENHLIGVGMDTEENTWGGVSMSGVKLSLFDVSDVENPVEISKYVIGGRGSYSYALYDHKAFLFDRDKEILVIPARVSDWDEGDEWRDVKYSDGAQVFRINLDDGFVFRGEITHQEEEPQEDYYYPRYDHSVKRSLYIDDVLYTMSEGKIKLNDLDDLEEIKELVFGNES